MDYDTQTTGYMGLWKTKSNLPNYHVHHNADCIKCSALHKEMVRVGAVIFCNKCVSEEFSTDDPVRDERETYLKWLHKSHGED